METEIKLENGWYHWMYVSPPNVLIEVTRSEWHSPSIVRPENISPMANVNGLYWRLTGIGKEELCKRS